MHEQPVGFGHQRSQTGREHPADGAAGIAVRSGGSQKRLLTGQTENQTVSPLSDRTADAFFSVSCGRQRGRVSLSVESPAGRQPEADGGSLAWRARAASAVALAGLFLCLTWLCLSVSGRCSGEAQGFEEAGAAAVAALREQEAVAVFLGLEDTEAAVPAMAEVTDGTGANGTPYPPEKPNVAGAPWSFYDYLAEAVARLLENWP